jgi:DNA-binding HxlR family transcriptional regulator
MSQELIKKYCPIIKPIELIGDVWTLMIIKSLLKESKRFNQIKAEIPEITNRTLSARLKSLCLKQVINREVGEENPPTVVYSLTELGHGMKEIIEAIENFGNKYLC